MDNPQVSVPLHSAMCKPLGKEYATFISCKLRLISVFYRFRASPHFGKPNTRLDFDPNDLPVGCQWARQSRSRVSLRNSRVETK